MAFTSRHIRWLFFALSVYAFLQCTFFIGAPAHLLLYLTAPSVDGHPVLLSPYDMVRYFNIVFNTGLMISGLLFIASAEPVIKHRVKNRRYISLPLAILATPFYFILLYLGSSGVSALCQ